MAAIPAYLDPAVGGRYTFFYMNDLMRASASVTIRTGKDLKWIAMEKQEILCSQLNGMD